MSEECDRFAGGSYLQRGKAGGRIGREPSSWDGAELALPARWELPANTCQRGSGREGQALCHIMPGTVSAAQEEGDFDCKAELDPKEFMSCQLATCSVTGQEGPSEQHLCMPATLALVLSTGQRPFQTVGHE